MAEYWLLIRLTDTEKLDNSRFLQRDVLNVRVDIPEAIRFNRFRRVVLAIGGHATSAFRCSSLGEGPSDDICRHAVRRVLRGCGRLSNPAVERHRDRDGRRLATQAHHPLRMRSILPDAGCP